VVAPATPAVPPTDPLPVPATEPLGSRPDPPAPRAPRRRTLEGPRRVVWAAVLLGMIGLVATEGVAWVAAERFRGALPGLEWSTLNESKSEYDGIRSWSVLDTGLRMRVNDPLRLRLVSLADSVIADYRREEPSMGPAEWRQALQSLQWALQLSPGDSSVMAKLLTSEAHVVRLGARSQPAATARQTYRRAVDKFREAAIHDPGSFDPYLGISRVAVYGLGDVEQAASAIEEAGKRGYVSGRRERALLGDGYLRRANASRALARTLSGDQRRRELEKARADYAGCIDAFDAIVGFGLSARNLELCKRQLERVELELAEDGRPLDI
jgi:hypothetical protein